jgi:NDP-sugar pyrophosphorylase family protein
VYPALIERGEPVHAVLSDAYWMDLGTPERYLQAHFDVLDGKVTGLRYGAPFVAPSANVAAGARVGRLTVVAEGAHIAGGAEVDRSVLHRGASVGGGARVTDSILGPQSSVAPGATVVGSVLAEEAAVAEGARAEGARLRPGELAQA